MKLSNCNSGKNEVFIVAELSANHDGDINIALKTIKGAYEGGNT